MKIFLAISLFLLVCFASSQVIGIDFGTEFWKASLISPGKNLVIVENSRSGRKSRNGISFLDGIRHFEYDALMKRLKKPKVSYFYLNKLIESLDHEKPIEGFTFENGTYYFKEGEDSISLEQMVGMIFKQVKQYSSEQAGSDIRDSVLTVPAHWGFKAKFALINAAAIADLSVLGLVNENSAAAIHFAITRNDTDPVNIGFFNLGSHNLQISIVQFFGITDPVREKNIQSLRVLSQISVPGVGGLHVDELLAQHVAAEFKTKHGEDIKSNIKSWTKLLHKCSDLKQTLSANKEAHIYIEGIINGIDLSMNIKREVLESSPIFEKLNGYLQESLDKAGIVKGDLECVEVIGGGSRIPIVGRILKEFFDPIEVGSHINGDQSMAFGASLRAANLSIAFRVKQLHFYDGNPESVKAVITNVEDGVLNETELFDHNSEQGLKKQVILDENENDVKVAIYYKEDIVHEYLLSNVSSWKDKYNSSALNFTEEPKLVLVFTAHSFNFAVLKEAYINITFNTSTTKEIYELVVENVTIEEKEKKESNETEKEEEKGEGEGEVKIDEEKADDKEEKAEESKSKEEESVKKEEGSQAQDNNTQSGESKKKSKKRTRERTRSVKKTVEDFKIQTKKSNLKINHQFSKYHRFTKQEIQEMKQVINKYEKYETHLKEKSKIRNDFESTLYALKDDFENPSLGTFSTEEELEKLKEAVTEELVWLDDNAWTAEKTEFEDHFQIIQNVYLPIVNRSNEYRDRQKYYNKTVEVLGLVYQKTSELNSSHPWVEEKAYNHLKKINETFEQIRTDLKEQIDRKTNQNIIYYNHQMVAKAEELRDQYYLIKMTPRPKVAKKVFAEVPVPEESKAEENLDLGDEDEKVPQSEEKNQEPAQQETQEEVPSKQDL